LQGSPEAWKLKGFLARKNSVTRVLRSASYCNAEFLQVFARHTNSQHQVDQKTIVHYLPGKQRNSWHVRKRQNHQRITRRAISQSPWEAK
jgi:hypothetical protein